MFDTSDSVAFLRINTSWDPLHLNLNPYFYRPCDTPQKRDEKHDTFSSIWSTDPQLNQNICIPAAKYNMETLATQPQPSVSAPL